SSSLSSVKSATMSSDTSPTPQVFRQLLIELDEIEVVQTAGNIEYQKASKVLDQFEKHIAKKDKPRAQITFSERHLAAKEQALQALQESSNLGNTAAMLRLAMYELLGEGISLDDSRGAESGLKWIKQAANSNDSRGQRLLSKMYYQGIGVPQDVASGKHWLDKAAKNGHPEAANVVMQWQQAQALIATQKQEQHSSKRYMVLFAVVIVMAILILVIV
ncbi:MAG: tetratricopeptide repeat protein, partial [Moraxellaceae bacterium]